MFVPPFIALFIALIIALFFISLVTTFLLLALQNRATIIYELPPSGMTQERSKLPAANA